MYGEIFFFNFKFSFLFQFRTKNVRMLELVSKQIPASDKLYLSVYLITFKLDIIKSVSEENS